jgi:hypothetical protein
LLDEDCKIPKHHDLMILWTSAKQIVIKIWPESSSDTIRSIDGVLTDLVNVDKLSDNFRYPIKKDGDPTLAGIKKINLKSFYKTITPIISDLEGMSMAISVYQDHKEEMMRQYRSNLGSI